MIKFITEEQETKHPTFGDVEIGQFFVSSYGNLCQKMNNISAISIADSSGEPFCNAFNGWDNSHLIVKILPKVTKIEF